jgi:hypothetical protein
MAKKKQKGNPRLTLTPEEFNLIQELRETGVIPDEYLIRSDMSFSKLKDRFGEVERRYKALLEQMKTKEETINHLLAINEPSKAEIKSLVKDLKKTGAVGNATAVMVASDWHIEERVDPSVVNNKNEYDETIATKRAAKFFNKGLWLTNLVRGGIKIKNLVLALLGDMISGYIHEELQEDNSMSPTLATMYVQEIICRGIDHLLSEGNFEKIIVPCCCGNHGRTTKKKRIATSYKNSYEWMMYKNLEKIYEKNSKVHFIIANGYHNYLPLYGYKIRFHHGDAIRYYGGVGGITIPVNKAIAQWNKSEEVYLDVFGHFHQQMMDAGAFVSNGSLIGWNAFAISIKAPYEAPRQSFFVIDQAKGKICDWPIFVE